MFNATGGYLTYLLQAHWSAACMYRHIQNSNKHLALTKEICHQKTLRVDAIKTGSFKMYASWP